MKSMSTMSTAYLNALAFAQERIQGPNLLRVMDKSSPRVPIMEHPDVRRMLLVQKCHAEGMRALCFYAASLQDEREIMHVADHKAAQLFDRRVAVDVARREPRVGDCALDGFDDQIVGRAAGLGALAFAVARARRRRG